MDELFYNINDDNKNKLLQQFEVYFREYNKDEVILSSIKNDHIICAVIYGHIQIVKNNFNGDRIIIEDLEDNSLFGSMSSNIGNTQYEIITKEKTKIMIIYLENVMIYNDKTDYYIQFIKNLLNVLYNKINDNNNRIEIITNKTIRDKLLAYFKLASKNGQSKIIYLPFNHSDLADYLAINRSAMARELKNLKDEGLIEIKGKKIKLLYYI